MYASQNLFSLTPTESVNNNSSQEVLATVFNIQNIFIILLNVFYKWHPRYIEYIKIAFMIKGKQKLKQMISIL